MVDHRRSVTIGKTGLTTTLLGLGTGPLGGMFQPVTDDQAHDTVTRAWDLGIRMFDTAPYYGYGSSEQRLGSVLRDRPRDEFVLATKVGKLLRPDVPPTAEQYISGENMFQGAPELNVKLDYSRQGVLTSLEESFERLGIDRVDIVHVHDPDEHYEEVLDGAYPALEQLRSEGVIKGISAGMNQAEMLERFARNADFDCFLLAGRYSLLDQGALDTGLFELVEERDIGILLGGVYNSGILARPEPGATFNYVPAPPELIDRAKQLQAVCDRYDVPLMAAAIQFPLGQPAVDVVLTGARSPAEIEENVRMLEHPVASDLWQELRHEGLLHERATVPSPEA